MINNNQDVLVFTDNGKPIYTASSVYVFKNKNQKSNYIKIPSGTEGLISVRVIQKSYNIEYYLIRFHINGQLYYGKLARSIIEFL